MDKTLTALERVIALQRRHVIDPVAGTGHAVCSRDGVRVHPHGKGWRHDTPEVVALNREAALVMRVNEDRVARPAQYRPI